MSGLIETVRGILRAGPPLRLAVLFGSNATGTAGPASDVDIAILPGDPSLPLKAELALMAELSRSLSRDVDLVRLDHASTLVRWQIARDGVLLVSDPAAEWIRFRARVASEHADLADGLARAASSFRRRLTRTSG